MLWVIVNEHRGNDHRDNKAEIESAKEVVFFHS